jgi:hypothetical protein
MKHTRLSRPAELQQQLCNRAQTSKILNTSIQTVRRLEKEGSLTAIRLRRNGRVQHSLAQVLALAAGRTSK